MTKKHFKQLAYQLAMVEPDVTICKAEYQTWLDCINAVAIVAAANNPRFDTIKFSNACSYEYWKTHKIPF